jgi:multidrug efflux pump subunit AcrA (membrane-fusion protein)
MKEAEADVALNKALVETAEINKTYTKVLSPISGRIGRSLVTEGALVTNDQTAALAIVQQLDPIYVDLNLVGAQDKLPLTRSLRFNVPRNSKRPLRHPTWCQRGCPGSQVDIYRVKTVLP